MRFLAKASALVLGLLLLVSCGSEPGTQPDLPLEELDCPEGSILTWDNTGGPFLLNWCSSCHGSAVDAEERLGAPIDINLDSYAEVHDKLDRLFAVAVVPGEDGVPSMPPDGRPPEAEIQRFAEWLRCGAP